MQQSHSTCANHLVLIALAMTVACLCIHANAQTYSVLYQFKSGNDGTFPAAGVAIDTKRVALYGTTAEDGQYAAGTVFKFNKSGESVLHSFTGEGGDGNDPYGNGTLVFDASGTMYGTVQGGGIYGGTNCLTSGCGIVFKVDQTGKETVLYQFQGGTDGFTPEGPVVIDAAGNVYGATAFGGGFGEGAVFKIDPSGNETALYSFTQIGDGSRPEGGVVMDGAGNLYGTTQLGGLYGGGTVFKISPSGAETILYNFGTNSGDGVFPTSSVSLDGQGNVYGTTYLAGEFGYGNVFNVTQSGSEIPLYNFALPGPAYPYYCGVITDTAGNIYGVTTGGGTYGLGTVYKIDTNRNITILHNFKGPDGKVPYGNLALDPSGNLYGTTSQGGKFGGGVIFRIKP